MFIDKNKGKYHCVNIGDSRLIYLDNYANVVQISEDHKPSNLRERQFIESRNGHVIFGRVNGILAMSRAIGDKYISNYLNKTPDYYEGYIKDILFFIQCSDGLTDVFSNNILCYDILEIMKKEYPVMTNKIPKKIIDDAIYNKKSGDNCTLSIVLI